MTQQAAPEVTSPAPTEAGQASTTIDERMAALAESLTPVGEDSDYEGEPKAAPKKAKSDDDEKPAKASKDDAEKEASPEDEARAARLKRREDLRAAEKARKEKNAFLEQRRQEESAKRSEADTEATRAELQRLKAIEASLTDPARFFEVAQGVGVDPRQLSAWLEKAANDPASMAAELATKKAREAVSPELEAMRAEVAAIKRAHEEQIQQARVAQERAAEAEFVALASRQGEGSAVAQWHEAFGDQQLIALANNLLPELPEGSTMEDLLDVVEERCSSIIQRLKGNPTKQPRKPEQPAQKNISSRARAERTEIDDPEAAMAGLSVDERFRLLATQLNNAR